LPDFAVTSWSFPNDRELFDFYWQAPAYASSKRYIGPPARLQQVARAWAFSLADRCPDEPVATYVRSLASPGEPILAPVLLHRVSLNGRPVWVLVAAWEYAIDDPHLGLGHIQIHLLDPSSGAIVGGQTCA
jgi:hypothetical protein